MILIIVLILLIVFISSALALDSFSAGKHDVKGYGSKNVAGSNTKTSLSKHEFFSTIIQYGKGYDWDIKIALAMSALETNYSRSCYFYNLFNVTTSSNNPLQFFKYPTIPDLKFKKYIGYNESVIHFWNLLKLSRYQIAYQNRHNPSACITALIHAGYAGNLRDPSRYLRVLNEITVYYNQHFGS